MNDAPALKKANVGIAVAGATSAAKGAADIILTEVRMIHHKHAALALARPCVPYQALSDVYASMSLHRDPCTAVMPVPLLGPNQHNRPRIVLTLIPTPSLAAPGEIGTQHNDPEL